MLDLIDIHCRINKTKILNGANLKLEDGQTIGLIGPNGSGKTTLFNCICGYVDIYKGSVVYQQQDISELEAYRRARLGIGRVFQNSGIFKELSLLDNMLLATSSNKEKAFEFLKQVNLQDKAQEKAGSLSGGQMRLLEIARTLSLGSELFLLDEPTAGVSPKMKKDVAKQIHHLKSLKKSILIIEHDISFIQEFCDLIAVLDSGKVMMVDTPDNVKSSEILKEIYFG